MRGLALACIIFTNFCDVCLFCCKIVLFGGNQFSWLLEEVGVGLLLCFIFSAIFSAAVFPFLLCNIIDHLRSAISYFPSVFVMLSYLIYIFHLHLHKF